MVDVNILHTFADELQASLDNYKKRDGFSLDVTTTEKCNFRCDYCFEGNKRYHDRQYSLDDMKNVLS